MCETCVMNLVCQYNCNITRPYHNEKNDEIKHSTTLLERGKFGREKGGEKYLRGMMKMFMLIFTIALT